MKMNKIKNNQFKKDLPKILQIEMIIFNYKIQKMRILLMTTLMINNYKLKNIPK